MGLFWRPKKRSDREVLDALEAEVRALTALVKFHNTREREFLMAFSEEVKAAVAAIGEKIDAAAAVGQEAVADIQALHAKIDGVLDQGDVEGARALLQEVSAKADNLSQKMAELKGVVDLPE